MQQLLAPSEGDEGRWLRRRDFYRNHYSRCLMDSTEQIARIKKGKKVHKIKLQHKGCERFVDIKDLNFKNCEQTQMISIEEETAISEPINTERTESIEHVLTQHTERAWDNMLFMTKHQFLDEAV